MGSTANASVWNTIGKSSITLLHIEGWRNMVKTTRKNKFQMRRFLIKLRSPFYKEIIFEAAEKGFK